MKMTLTVEDCEDGSHCAISMEFEPSVNLMSTKPEDMTPAMITACRLIEAISEITRTEPDWCSKDLH